MNTKERDEKIEQEASGYGRRRTGIAKDYTNDVALLMGSILHESYRAGANSKAMREWIVKRAVELARDGTVKYTEQSLEDDAVFTSSPDEILEIIKVELEGK